MTALPEAGLSPDPPPAPRPLTGGAVMSATSRIVVAVTGAAATIVVARLLGPAGSGAFAVAQTLVLMLTVGTTLGVEHGIAYYVSSGRWSAAGAFRDSQLLALGSGIAGAFIGIFARLVVPSAFHGLSLSTVLIAAAALPFSLSWFYTSYLSLATDRYETYVLPATIQSILAMFLVAVLAVAGGIRGAVIGFTLAHAITAVAMFIVGRRAFLVPADGVPEPEPEASGQLRQAISFGIKGYASNALQFVNYRLDLFILNATVSTIAVGQYSVAVAVTTVLWLLPQALSDVLFPRVAALSASSAPNAEDARAMTEVKSLRHTVLATVAATIVLALALVLLVVPVYGPRFRPAIGLGLILLPGAALLGLAGPLSATVLGRGHIRMMLIVALVVTPFTVILYVTLIPLLHAAGAALASTLSYSATFALSALFYGRVTGRSAFGSMRPTRSELTDYRRLGPAVAAWADGLLPRNGHR
jgi:enterobacterial common antigen flippase